MIADDLFEPCHVIPASEFIATAIESADSFKTKVLVEFYAVVGEVLIIFLGISDTGVKIQYTHVFQFPKERLIKRSAESLSRKAVVKVN